VPNEGLKELYVDELKDLYNAENQLVKALPKAAKAASSEELRAGFEEHLEQTKSHVQRLEQIFEMLDESPKGKKCKGMEGLIEEGSEIMEEDFEGALLDAALIGAAQRVEHYEIAAYGTVRAFAEELGESEHASLLAETLEEEKETDLIVIREEYFQAIVRGYLSEMKEELSSIEMGHIVYSGKFMIYMQALRFLTDHLNDDRYYGAKYEGHNLVRAVNQLTLLQRLTEKEPALNKMVQESIYTF